MYILGDLNCDMSKEETFDSGIIHTEISDHSLVFAIRKIGVFQKEENVTEIRNMKNFNEKNFVDELINLHWEYVFFFGHDPNTMWEIWKEHFLEVLNKHAPLQRRKHRFKKVPWINSLIHTRDKLKRKAIISKLKIDWSNYKKTRNQVNIELLFHENCWSKM